MSLWTKVMKTGLRSNLNDKICQASCLKMPHESDVPVSTYVNAGEILWNEYSLSMVLMFEDTELDHIHSFTGRRSPPTLLPPLEINM